MTDDDREIQRKLRILRHTEQPGHVSKTCRSFGIGRDSFYRWRARYSQDEEAGLVNLKLIPKTMPNKTSSEFEEKVL